MSRALILACVVMLAGCGEPPPPVECVNIASRERLTDTSINKPDFGRFGFTGTDYQGFRRFVSFDDARWWKCRYAASPKVRDQ